MKTKILQPIWTVLTSLPLTILAVNAQTVGTSDGGGITQAGGGNFSLAATVGQRNAAVSRGGSYLLESGFWHGITVVETPGAPKLRIRLEPGPLAVLSWPADATGFVLEETTNVAGGPWIATRATPVVVGAERSVSVSAAGVIKCYRLRKP